jgi:hypothetical protein
LLVACCSDLSICEELIRECSCQEAYVGIQNPTI